MGVSVRIPMLLSLVAITLVGGWSSNALAAEAEPQSGMISIIGPDEDTSTSAQQNIDRASAPQTVYGPISRTDTLWRIANNVRPAKTVSVYQVMAAIYQYNPTAFEHQNLNLLSRGAMLQIPSLAEIQAISPARAKQIIAVAGKPPAATKTAQPVEKAASSTTPAATGQDLASSTTDKQPDAAVDTDKPSDTATQPAAEESEETSATSPATETQQEAIQKIQIQTLQDQLADANASVMQLQQQNEALKQQVEDLLARVEALQQAQLQSAQNTQQQLKSLQDELTEAQRPWYQRFLTVPLWALVVVPLVTLVLVIGGVYLVLRRRGNAADSVTKSQEDSAMAAESEPENRVSPAPDLSLETAIETEAVSPAAQEEAAPAPVASEIPNDEVDDELLIDEDPEIFAEQEENETEIRLDDLPVEDLPEAVEPEEQFFHDEHEYHDEIAEAKLSPAASSAADDVVNDEELQRILDDTDAPDIDDGPLSADDIEQLLADTEETAASDPVDSMADDIAEQPAPTTEESTDTDDLTASVDELESMADMPVQETPEPEASVPEQVAAEEPAAEDAVAEEAIAEEPAAEDAIAEKVIAEEPAPEEFVLAEPDDEAVTQDAEDTSPVAKTDDESLAATESETTPSSAALEPDLSAGIDDDDLADIDLDALLEQDDADWIDTDTDFPTVEELATVNDAPSAAPDIAAEPTNDSQPEETEDALPESADELSALADEPAMSELDKSITAAAADDVLAAQESESESYVDIDQLLEEGTDEPVREPYDPAVLDKVDLGDPLADHVMEEDEVGAKLDLAKAYIEIGDSTVAKQLLVEVQGQGDTTQQTEASALLRSLAD